jgi:F0F1-type ATP synthase assembly protein I
MKYGAVAFEFIGMIAAGVFVGYELDAWAGTDPWFITLFTVVGTVGGFYRMIQILLQFEREK